MWGEKAGWVNQEATAGRDVNVAGRDQVIINVVAPGAGKPVVPRLLPRDVPGFTGRESQLDRLTDIAGNGSAVVIAISGTAGVGKTALAVHAAHLLLPQFPGGHLYADLHGYTEGQAPEEPGKVLDLFLRSLGVAVEKFPAKVEERSGLLRQLLASRRVLIVLDNAVSEAQVRPLLPGVGKSMVLITSRSALAGLEVDDRISLDVLSTYEADALLKRLIGPERVATEPGSVERVRDLCGCLPLALRIAGQLLAAHPSWPVARLAWMLADEQNRLGCLSVGDLQVRAAFAVSYRQLEDDDAKMFRLLGLHPGRDFDVLAAASLAGVDPHTAGATLNRLVLGHLVIENVSGRFDIHDLLRLFARSTCQEADDDATREAAQGRLIRHYAALVDFLDSCLDPGQRMAVAKVAGQVGLSAPSLLRALAMFEAERPSLVAALGLAAQKGWHQLVSQLGGSWGSPLVLLHHLDDLLTVAEAALAAARHNGNRSSEATALSGGLPVS